LSGGNGNIRGRRGHFGSRNRGCLYVAHNKFWCGDRYNRRSNVNDLLWINYGIHGGYGGLGTPGESHNHNGQEQSG
jgi:hypothetical protein